MGAWFLKHNIFTTRSHSTTVTLRKDVQKLRNTISETIVRGNLHFRYNAVDRILFQAIPPVSWRTKRKRSHPIAKKALRNLRRREEVCHPPTTDRFPCEAVQVLLMQTESQRISDEE